MSENVTTKIVSLLKGSGIIFGSSILNKAVLLGIHLLIVNTLSPARYGFLAIIITISTFISSLCIGGIPDGLARLIAGSESQLERGKLTGSSFLVATLASLIPALLLTLFHYELALLFNEPILDRYWTYIILLQLLQIFSSLLKGLLRGYEMSSSVALTTNIFPYLLTVPLLLFGFTTGINPEYIVLGYWMGNEILQVTFSIFFISRHNRPINTPTIESLQNLLGFSWPLLLSSSFVLFMSTLDILFIGVFHPSEFVGYYKAVQPITQVLMLGLSSVVFLYLPLATQYYEADKIAQLRQLYQTTSKWLSILSFPMVTVFSLYPEQVIAGLMGDKYVSGAPVLIILTLAVFTRIVVGPNGATAQAINQPRLDLIASAVGAGTNIALNIVLVPRWAATGAAIATLVGFIAYNFVEIFGIYHHTRVHPFTLDLIKSILPLAIISLGLKAILPESLSLLALIGIGIVLTTLQLLIIPITGSFDETDQELLQIFRTRF